MFGSLGGPELFLILVVALIVFGPRKLPEIGKSLGKMMVEFRKASTDFRQTIESEIEADKLRSLMEAPKVEEPGAQLKLVRPAEIAPAPAEAAAPEPTAVAAEGAV